MFNSYFCLTSRYASTVMEVYKVNEELNKQLKEVSTFTAQFTAEAGNNQNPEVGLELYYICCLHACRTQIVAAGADPRELQGGELRDGDQAQQRGGRQPGQRRAEPPPPRPRVLAVRPHAADQKVKKLNNGQGELRVPLHCFITG